MIHNFLKGLLMLLMLVFFSCSKDDPKPATGKLQGNVSDAESGSALGDVRVVIFNADDNAPTSTTLVSDGSGNFAANLTPGNYFLKLYKQGYNSVPSPGMEAVAFTIIQNATNEQFAEMLVSEIVNAGMISGKIISGGKAVPGALVVAQNSDGTSAYSGISDGSGNYIIYNVPAGSYTVNGYIASFNGTSVDASVSPNGKSMNIDVSLAPGAAGTLSGSVRNLAAENKDVDISLVHPLTKETIPGLTTTSVNQNYTITKVPDGSFIARASFKNDARVMDPDRIAKFGEPLVSFAGAAQEIVFDVTGSLSLKAPSNAASTNVPVEITSITPTFEWNAYSSTSDYVVEVVDAATGVVIWGGFDKSGVLPVKKLTIPSGQRTVVYNFDGQASQTSLTPGRVYRWRVYASKDDQNADTKWTIISASEDQLGLFKISE